MNQLIRNFLQGEEGATAVEYGLLAALISIVIIAAVTSVGRNLRSVFHQIAHAL